MKPVPRRAGFIAEMHLVAGCRDPHHHSAHALVRGVHLADETHLTATLAIRNGYGFPRLRNIDPDENFSTALHGSSSCGEDRLGHSEQPSKTQCRASHLGSADIRSYPVAAFCELCSRRGSPAPNRPVP
jgi:hypothetical protein